MSVKKQNWTRCLALWILILVTGSLACGKKKSTYLVEGGADGGCKPGAVSSCFCPQDSLNTPDDSRQGSGTITCRSDGNWGSCQCSPLAPGPSVEPAPGEPAVNLPDNLCPSGMFRIHIRDLWSKTSSPTLGVYPSKARTILVLDSAYNGFGAKLEQKSCQWYEGCIPVGIGTFLLKPINPGAECAESVTSGGFAIGADPARKEAWIEYRGTNLASDYAAFPQVPLGPHAFSLTAINPRPDGDLASGCAAESSGGPASDVTVLHLRWPWSDPARTGYAGTACEDERAGIQTPPYPTSLKVVREGCAEAVATLEHADGKCPWYRLVIPNSQWTGSITIRHADNKTLLFTPDLPLPAPRTASEYWLTYDGAADDASNQSNCMNWSMRKNVYHFYPRNPGPGCGTTVVEDPCNPILPEGFSVVHFRYLWAGQKNFSFFPRDEFMPQHIVLEVNGGGGDKDIICFQEGKSPWFLCKVPDAEFHAGARWRAVDKSRSPEWNTVLARPFPEKPAQYWLRWNYGKPDYEVADPRNPAYFKFYTYHPDGPSFVQNQDWGENVCLPREQPPMEYPVIQMDGYFPYDETLYEYAFGGSLARWYDKPEAMQDLLNYFVFERYQIWKKKYVLQDDAVCGAGSAAVVDDWAGGSTSEMHGYGMAIAAAMGDRGLFEKLLNFVRRRLSQDRKKFCGGLLGWKWGGPGDCRPLDKPCDPDQEGCGGTLDSAFDGDVEVGIGLVFAAQQWPDYRDLAVDWLQKMECEINTTYDGKWNYPAPGDTWDKIDCSGYPGKPCAFVPGRDGNINLSYNPPGGFRAFGEFLDKQLGGEEGKRHRSFWSKTAETVWELVERCYENSGVHPALIGDSGSYSNPCGGGGAATNGNHEWSRGIWRLAIDAAWYGGDESLPENSKAGSGRHPGKGRLQAKLDLLQNFYAHEFPASNPPEPNANRFSRICSQLTPSGKVSGCDPAFEHDGYFVNTAMCAFVPLFDNDGKTTPAMRREAVEEAVTGHLVSYVSWQETIGLYTLLFLTGNFPNPLDLDPEHLPIRPVSGNGATSPGSNGSGSGSSSPDGQSGSSPGAASAVKSGCGCQSSPFHGPDALLSILTLIFLVRPRIRNRRR